MMNQHEFTAAVEQYSKLVYRVAYSWLGNSDDANDIAQEALVQLYMTDKEFESPEHLKNWLTRVTVNLCKKTFRTPWHRREDIEQYAETIPFEQEDYQYLFEAIMKLDKKYRVPLVLFYLEGYSTSEIAAMLKLGENTVSTRLRRAKAKLKLYLEEV